MDSNEADQFTAFLAVVETGSFSAAGRRIGRDGSVVTRRVGALEARLGIRLFERSTRRVALTEAGAKYRDRLRQVMDLLRAADDEARSLASTPTGLLRISAPLGFGRLWIAPAIPEFLALHPRLRIEVSYTDRYVDLIGEGFDAGVRIGDPGDSRLVARRLATMQRLLCASPGYLARHPAPRTPDDLSHHDCIGFTPLSTYPLWHLTQGETRRSIRIAGRLVTDDIDALLQATLAGTGIAMGTDWLVGRELATGQLVPVLPD